MDEPLTEEQVQYILRDWRTTLDTCRDDPELFRYDLVGHVCSASECEESYVKPGRYELKPEQRQQMDHYIRVLASDYPFQLQKAFALSRLHKFLDMWESTHKFAKAMRVI